MEVGDLFESEGVRWLVLRVVRNTAWVRSSATSNLPIPANSEVEILCNPQKEWVHVPVKRTGPATITEVTKPFLLHGGGGVQNLAAFHDWIDAGAGIYVAPHVGLLRGDVLNVTLSNGRHLKVTIKSLDTLGRKMSRANARPAEPLTAFERLLEDD